MTDAGMCECVVTPRGATRGNFGEGCSDQHPRSITLTSSRGHGPPVNVPGAFARRDLSGSGENSPHAFADHAIATLPCRNYDSSRIDERHPQMTSSTDRQPSLTTAERSWSPVVELRQYALHPGKRDVLIDLFDREFIESQEALGMRVIGQFRDVDDPDRFVWLRGFRDMATRAEGLKTFYGGPVWKAHRDVANATMIDSDNVLLLRPARQGSGFSTDVRSRPPRGAKGPGPGLVTATVYFLEARAENAMIDYFDRTLKPTLIDAGAAVLAFFVTEPSTNTFPTLPVRENENVFVWFAGFVDATTEVRGAADPSALNLSAVDAPGLNGPPQRLRLTPTARSLLTGSSRACPAVSPSRRGT